MATTKFYLLSSEKDSILREEEKGFIGLRAIAELYFLFPFLSLYSLFIRGAREKRKEKDNALKINVRALLKKREIGRRKWGIKNRDKRQNKSKYLFLYL